MTSHDWAKHDRKRFTAKKKSKQSKARNTQKNGGPCHCTLGFGLALPFLCTNQILLMAQMLHQLVGSLHHQLQCFWTSWPVQDFFQSTIVCIPSRKNSHHGKPSGITINHNDATVHQIGLLQVFASSWKTWRKSACAWHKSLVLSSASVNTWHGLVLWILTNFKQCSVVCCLFLTFNCHAPQTVNSRTLAWSLQRVKSSLERDRAPSSRSQGRRPMWTTLWLYSFRRSELLTRMHPWELRQRREALEKTPLIISDVFSCFLTQSAPKLIETPAWWVQETWASSCTATRFPNCLPSQARQLSSQYLCISNIITYMIHMCIHIYIYMYNM